jgi:hypothetical protein
VIVALRLLMLYAVAVAVVGWQGDELAGWRVIATAAIVGLGWPVQRRR